jgi:hypothetical protein
LERRVALKVMGLVQVRSAAGALQNDRERRAPGRGLLANEPEQLEGRARGQLQVLVLSNQNAWQEAQRSMLTVAPRAASSVKAVMTDPQLGNSYDGHLPQPALTGDSVYSSSLTASSHSVFTLTFTARCVPGVPASRRANASRRADRDGVAGDHILDRLAPSLHAHAPFNDEQPLRTGMLVPVGARTGAELDTVHTNRHASVVFGKTLHVRDARKRVRVGGLQRNARGAKDFHGCR